MARDRSPTRDRVRPALVKMQGRVAVILCPFCQPSHPITPNEQALCGTTLELQARQIIYRWVTCALCGEKGGTLIRMGDKYKHSHDCTPGKTLLAASPRRSFIAALVWRLPNRAHNWIGRRFGLAATELTKAGKVTGYAWNRLSEAHRAAIRR